MKKLKIYLIALFGMIHFISCNNLNKSENNKEDAPEPNSVENKNENGVSLTADQIKTIGIELGEIEQKELTNSIKANGILTVPNQNKAFVVPLYSGVIKTLNVQTGSFVKQGQAIATIINPNLIQMQQQLQQVNTQISLTEIEFNRQKQLVEGNASPLKKLQQVERGNVLRLKRE